MNDTVFMSYRGCDEPFAALYLEAELTKRFGPGQVFRDSRAILLGTHFPDRLARALQHCHALIAVIGDCWLCRGSDGQRRVDNPRDYVRYEIAAALRRDIRVIPILVGDSRLPPAVALPPDIADLVRRQYLQLRYRGADEAVARLVEQLRPVLGKEGRGVGHGPLSDRPPAAVTTSHHFYAPVDARRSVLGVSNQGVNVHDRE